MYSQDDAGSSSNTHIFVVLFWLFLVLGGFQIFLGPKIHINEKNLHLKSLGKWMKVKEFLVILRVYIWIYIKMSLFQGA